MTFASYDASAKIYMFPLDTPFLLGYNLMHYLVEGENDTTLKV